jgi:hypothetical protein
VVPMDADDWLKSIEKKLQVVQCNNYEKVLLVSYQISGPAADWWDAESTQGGIAIQVWPTRHNLSVVDFNVITGLSLLRVPHFRAMHGPSLKIIHPDTTFTSINKCFLVSRRNTRKHTNVGKSLELRIARAIFRVGQITHIAITKNKQDQVIATMHTSKLKTNSRTKHIRTRTQSL